MPRKPTKPTKASASKKAPPKVKPSRKASIADTPVKKAAKRKPKLPEPGSTIIGKIARLPRKPPREKREPIKYRGAAISPNLEERVRKLRDKYRKAGRFVSFDYILDWYFQTEDEFCAGGDAQKPYEAYSVWKAEWPFSYEYVDLVSEDIEYQEPEYNGNLEYLFRFIEERGKDNVRLYVRGVGESKARRYGVNAGLSKVMDENSLIGKWWSVFWKEIKETSPQPYRVPICFNAFSGVFFIDFNRTDYTDTEAKDWIENAIIDAKGERNQDPRYRDESDTGWGAAVTAQFPKDKAAKKQGEKAGKVVKLLKDKSIKKKKKKKQITSVIMERTKKKKLAKKAAAKPKKVVKKSTAKKAPRKPAKAIKRAVVKKAAPVKKTAAKAPTAAQAKALIKQLEKMGYVITKRKATKPTKAAAKPTRAVKKAAKVVKKPVAKKAPAKPAKAIKRTVVKKVAPVKKTAVKKAAKVVKKPVARKAPAKPVKAVKKAAAKKSAPVKKTAAKRGPGRPPKVPAKKVGRPAKKASKKK